MHLHITHYCVNDAQIIVLVFVVYARKMEVIPDFSFYFSLLVYGARKGFFSTSSRPSHYQHVFPLRFFPPKKKKRSDTTNIQTVKKPPKKNN